MVSIISEGHWDDKRISTPLKVGFPLSETSHNSETSFAEYVIAVVSGPDMPLRYAIFNPLLSVYIPRFPRKNWVLHKINKIMRNTHLNNRHWDKVQTVNH